MVETRFAEDEGLDKARQWWKKNGTSVITGVALGVAVVAGWNGWQMWTRHRAESAADLYVQLDAAAASGRVEQAAGLAERLTSDFAGQPYAANAALMLARLEVGNGRPDQAVRWLTWVLDNGADDSVRHAARLRLAQIALDGGDAGRALEILDTGAGGQGAFATHYEELRGDALMARGEAGAAAEAYQEALAALTPGSSYGSVLNDKITHATGMSR